MSSHSSKPSDFALAVAATLEQYKPACATFATSVVVNRHFIDPRYINSELMINGVALILGHWCVAELSNVSTYLLSTVNEVDCRTYLSKIVREQLQQQVVSVLCPIHDRFRGQDDGLFDITTTDTYKVIHWDLVEFIIEMVGMYSYVEQF